MFDPGTAAVGALLVAVAVFEISTLKTRKATKAALNSVCAESAALAKRGVKRGE